MGRHMGPRIKCICKLCNKVFNIHPSAYKRSEGNYCSGKCFHKSRIGKRGPNFGRRFSKQWRENIGKSQIGKRCFSKKGGRAKTNKGYMLQRCPKHPFVIGSGYILEHRFVMEQYLKRCLTPEERVHHINGIKTDNRIENLKLFANESKHSKFHYPTSPFYKLNSSAEMSHPSSAS